MDRLRLALVASRADDQEVRVADQLAHVERDHVAPPASRRRSRRSAAPAPPSPAAPRASAAALALIAVEPPLGDQLGDRVGHQVADRASRRDAPPDARRGDPDLRHLDELGPLAARPAARAPPRPRRARSAGRAAIPSRASSRTRSGLRHSRAPPRRRRPSGTRTRRLGALRSTAPAYGSVNDGPSRLVSRSETRERRRSPPPAASSRGARRARARARSACAAPARSAPAAPRSSPSWAPPPGRAPGARCAAG